LTVRYAEIKTLSTEIVAAIT